MDTISPKTATLGLNADTISVTNPRPRRTESIFPEIQFAPEFRPSMSEFTDPLAYISSIRSIAEPFGICKIIPPESWNPKFSLDTKTFMFQPRIQRLNTIEGKTRSSVHFIEKLQKFHQHIGSPLTRLPTLNGRPVDLYRLRKEVMNRGGHEQVEKTNGWPAMGRLFSKTLKLSTSSSYIKSAYYKYILPYEEYLKEHGDFGEDISVKSVIGMPTEKSAKKSDSNEEPIRRVSSRIRQKSKEPSKPSISKSSFDSGKECMACHGQHDQDLMVTCDECENSCHLSCVIPPLKSIPQEEWYCMPCIENTGKDFGFEDSDERTLAQFQALASEFKKDHFQALGGHSLQNLTELDTEKEFWRLVESLEDIEVEYGADIHSTLHGSGFPTVELHPENPYSRCPWNLNNIALLPDSVLSKIRKEVSGMTNPWVYIGMVFSTFCWHTEDHHTYSINFLHWGETKTWYGVPSSDAEAFETVMKNCFPELFAKHPDLLFHITTLISPARLLEKGVKVSCIDQRPGEIVVTFPKAYHAGFNHGFNCAEAVNFALPDWIPYGLECVKRYSEYKKMPVFSHDELLIWLSKGSDIWKMVDWLAPAMEELVSREENGRSEFFEKYPMSVIQSMTDPLKEIHVLDQRSHRYLQHRAEMTISDNDQCLYCHAYCYLSAAYCPCMKDQVTCLYHLSHICQCEHPKPTLKIRYTIEELEELRQSSEAILQQRRSWLQLCERRIVQVARPTAKDIFRLVELGDSIEGYSKESPYPYKELGVYQDLCVFSSHVDHWIYRAKILLGDDHAKEKYRSTKILSDLVSEWEHLAFDSPEVSRLFGLADQANEFMSLFYHWKNLGGDQASHEYHQLMAMQKNMNLRIPEFDDFKANQFEVSWSVEVRKVFQFLEDMSKKTFRKYLDYETVLSLIDSGKKGCIRYDHSIMQKLRRLKEKGDQWRIRCQSLFKQKHVSLSEIDAVLENGALAPVDLSLIQELEKWALQIKSTITDIKTFVRHRGLDSKDTPIADIRHLLQEVEQRPVERTEEVYLLKEELRKYEQWELNCRKTMFRNHQSKPVLELLKECLITVMTCTETFENHVYTKTCICCQKKDAYTIDCRICGEQYHGECMKLVKTGKDGVFVCPVCDPSMIMGHQKPSMESLLVLLSQIKNLKLTCPERSTLEKMVKYLRKWKYAISTFLQSFEPFDQRSVTKLKQYLRCTLGLPIFLSEEAELSQCISHYCPLYTHRPQPPKPAPPMEDPTVFCICRKFYNPAIPMIACDNCEEWYHFQCMNVDPHMAEKESFLCAICLGYMSAPRWHKLYRPEPIVEVNELPVQVKKIMLRLPEVHVDFVPKRRKTMDDWGTLKRSKHDIPGSMIHANYGYAGHGFYSGMNAAEAHGNYLWQPPNEHSYYQDNFQSQ